MATDEKLNARQKIAEQLDKLLDKPTSDVTVEGFKMNHRGSPDWSTAGLSDAEVDKYITRKKRGLLAEEIKGADDPLGYVQGLEESDRMGDLPGGVTRQQAERLAKLTTARRAGEQAAARAQTPYKRPEMGSKIAKPLRRESDDLSAAEMQAAGFGGIEGSKGFGGLAELKRMQEDREAGRGFKGLGKGTALTTPGQKLRRAARMANRQGETGRASQLAQQAAAIEPVPTSFFKSPSDREAAKAAQGDVMVQRAKKKAEEAR